ncbi:putative flagellar hook capping protein [Leptospira santarosai str. HAI1380]|nr:putative flagellar hook capping protein [Leptospira santarosai str. HAI1380]
MENLEKEEKNGLKGIEIRSTVKSLGKDDFLKLLITQLSSQDPTNPVKDQDFIAQMAQFSSLEQMSNISTGIQKMGNRQSFSLVGKLVSGPDFVTGENVAGIAGALFFDGEGKTFVRVNGRSIDVEQISLISDPTVLKEQEAAYNQAQVQQNQIGPSKPNTAGTTEMTTNAPHAKTEIPSQEFSSPKVSPNASDTELVSEKQGEVGAEQQIQKKGVAEKKTSDWKFPGKNKSSSY